MQRTATPTAMLRAEHRLILSVVAALEAILERHAPGALPLDDVDACTTFFRLFTDACHHGKEEDLLFAALEEHGLPAEEGPLGMMRAEHRLGRSLVGALRAASERLRGGDGAAERELRAAADSYIELIRAHIAKEDGALFEMADQIVAGDACAALCAAYDSVCVRRFEGRSLASLEQSAAELSARYG
jgi:hemerythrin-like domain-containing protein